MKDINFRIREAGEILQKLHVKSVVDVGCRGCAAKNIMPDGVKYFGNDLFQNHDKSVSFVGDVLTTEFGRTFDCVMALDIVEHVDDPYTLMDKLISLADKYLIISLPNVYDMSHKYDFVIHNTLGGKYHFGIENSMDRHRWIMNYDEIHAFYQAYSEKYDMELVTKDLITGDRSKYLLSRIASKILRHILGKKMMTKTVIALFTKNMN